MHTDVWHNKERYYCFKNDKKQGRYVQNQQKKSSSNINTLSNDPTSIIIYRKRRYEHVYDYYTIKFSMSFKEETPFWVKII